MKESIAIIGAGIGGLAAGVFLSRLGFEVTIYEQASRFARVGAGIQQTPNAMRVHRRLGTERRATNEVLDSGVDIDTDHHQLTHDEPGERHDRRHDVAARHPSACRPIGKVLDAGKQSCVRAGIERLRRMLARGMTRG